VEYHNPVLLQESIDALVSDPSGTYIDCTYGGGGHSREIFKRLDSKGKLIGFDQDNDVLPNLISENDSQFLFVPQNFRHLRRYLRIYGIEQVDGLLADLGVSSHQFDEPERGFSYRFDAPLDMRMDQSIEMTAADLVNQFSAAELQSIFSKYGEVRNSKSLAEQIVKMRRLKPVKTINDFLAVVNPLVRGNRAKYLAQVFQAIRIEVNDEMGALLDLLNQATEILKPGGKLVIISYHSLEDRLVKNFIKSGNADGVHQSDHFGNIYRPFIPVNKKAILPSAEETAINPRARSAKMRIAIRTEA